MNALGLMEIKGLVPALNAVDCMLKTANVKFLTWEKKLGGWLVTVVVQGEVSAVTEAVNYAKDQAINTVAAYAVIPNPHEEVYKLIQTSAEKNKFAFNRFEKE